MCGTDTCGTSYAVAVDPVYAWIVSSAHPAGVIYEYGPKLMYTSLCPCASGHTSHAYIPSPVNHYSRARVRVSTHIILGPGNGWVAPLHGVTTEHEGSRRRWRCRPAHLELHHCRVRTGFYYRIQFRACGVLDQLSVGNLELCGCGWFAEDGVGYFV